MKSFIILALLSSVALATTDIDKRPPNLSFRDGQAVFMDITKAYYEVIYDTETKTAKARASLEVLTAEDGHPIFDSLQEPTSIKIDGIETSNNLVSTPDKKTLVRVINQGVSAGSHLIEIELPLKELVTIENNEVRSAFFMGDLEDRGYMEKYFPTNFLFDRIPMVLKINFTGASNQRIYTNGDITKISDSEFEVDFRSDINNSCPYFQTVPKGTYLEREFKYPGLKGDLPVLLYTTKEGNGEGDLDRMQALITKLLTELEGDYGPFLHPKARIFIYKGAGGMEYSGATTATEESLGHELFHSYFARGVMPANGNAGWIDEALARWRDNGYKSNLSYNVASNIAALGTYDRLTDRRSYGHGSQVMGYFDAKFKGQGGLKPFLRKLIQDRAFDPITTEEFVRAMNEFYGVDNMPEFKHFVYEQPNSSNRSIQMPAMLNDVHRQLDRQELHHLLR